MPYENVPATNAPPIPVQIGEFGYEADITGIHLDGFPRATIDDLGMFDPGAKVGNLQLLAFLDRVIVRVTFRGEPLLSRKSIKESYEEDGETKERERIEEHVEGVTGKRIPYGELPKIFQAVGAAMKAANNAGN